MSQEVRGYVRLAVAMVELAVKDGWLGKDARMANRERSARPEEACPVRVAEPAQRA